MLKVVFLFLALLAWPASTLAAGSPAETDENTAQRVQTDSGFVMEVQVGEQRHHYDTEAFSYYPNTMREVEGYHVVVGRVQNTQKGEASDARQLSFVIYFDSQGNEISKQYYDDAYVSDIRDAFELKDGHVLVLQESSDSEQSAFLRTRFILKDGLGIVDEHIESVQYRTLDHVHDFLYLHGTDEDSDALKGLHSIHQGLIESEGIYGISESERKDIPFSAYILGEGTLNNQSKSGRVFIDYPGHYVFENTEGSTSFTLDATYDGVTQGAVYHEPVYVEIDKGHAFLNHDLYVSGKPIDDVGTHRLRIEGVGDYEKIVDFTITSNIQGVEDAGFYTEPRTITFNGEGYLDNHKVNSGLVIDESGEYTLSIEGVGNHVETYEFSVDIDADPQSMFTPQRAMIGGAAMLVCGGAILVKRKR